MLCGVLEDILAMVPCDNADEISYISRSSWSRSNAGLSQKPYRYRILFSAKNQSFHTSTSSVEWCSCRPVPEHSSEGLPMRDEGMSPDEIVGLLKSYRTIACHSRTPLT